MSVANFVGRWNIYEASIWSRATLDLIDPDQIAFDARRVGVQPIGHVH